MEKFPNIITFKSDNNKVRFVQETKAKEKDKRYAEYKYFKSRTKRNTSVWLYMDHIDALHKSGLIKIE